MKIIVTQPTRGLIIAEAQDALDRELAANNQIPLIIRTYDMALPLSRNYLVETALQFKDWTHILLMDDDVILPKGGLKELINLKTDVAVMDYPMKTMGTTNESYGTVVTDKDKSVAWAGLGSVLIKREVFEKISQPWFILTQHRIQRSNDGQIGFFASQEQGGMKLSAGEDTFFFLQVRKAGFKVKVAKKIAKHCYIENLVSPVANLRYQSTHKIVKRDKIDGEFV
jgi:hypothetical protein